MEEVDVMVPFARHPETVTISTARHLNLGNPLAEGVTTSDNLFIDVIKDVLNVQVVIDWEVIPADYANMLNLAIASDTLPDVFIVSDYLTLRWLAQKGRLADLTEAFEKCVGGYDAIFLSRMKDIPSINFYYNGMLKGIASSPVGYNYNLLWVRQDWLDKLALPPPTTPNEIKETALAFINANMGGPNTRGILVDPVNVLASSYSFLSLSTVANSFGAYPQAWVADSNGNAVYGSILPEMKDALAELNSWYTAGVLDPRFMSYPNMDAVTPAIRDGRCGMFFGAFWSPWIVGYSIEDPNAQWMPVLAPVNNEGIFNHTNSNIQETYLVISSRCESPAAAIKAVNVAYELQRGAFSDDPYIKAEIDRLTLAGSFDRTLNPFAGSLSSMFEEEMMRSTAIIEYSETGIFTPIPGLPEDRIKEDAERSRAWHLSDRIMRTAEDLRNRILYESSRAGVMVFHSDDQHNEPIVFSGNTESMEDYWATLLALEERMVIQIISGIRPLEYFYEFVKEWKSSGGDIITQEVNAILNNR
jgi:putative aldouronate transport system substrate-binding protein